MHFVYEGFTHKGDIRSFAFNGIEESKVSTPFSIEIDLILLARYRVAMQDGPSFCLQMLTSASAAGGSSLEKFHRYRVVEEDLRPILVDRERRAAIKALKPPSRRFTRTPPATSHLRGLGVAPEQKP